MLRNFIFLFFTLVMFNGYAVTQDIVALNQDKAIQAKIVHPKQLIPHEENKVVLKLEHKQSGQPVLPEEIKTVHTKKVHLLIIDPSLTDYHHQHPQPGEEPGEYAFSFTPNTTNNYRIWVDIVPEGGEQEYVIVDLMGADSCMQDCYQSIENRTVTKNGFTYALSLEPEQLVLNQPAQGQLTVTDKEGQPLTELEPIMEEFAHLVGFYDDYVTIAHIHPMGPTPETEDDRGGPHLNFHIMPGDAGYLKLFSQVKIDGQERFAGFGLTVDEAETS